MPTEPLPLQHCRILITQVALHENLEQTLIALGAQVAQQLLDIKTYTISAFKQQVLYNCDIWVFQVNKLCIMLANN